MATMKAALYMKNQQFELADVEIPEVTADHVKVKIAYCALCATDVHVLYHDLYNRPAGFGLGHELSGVIEELGEGAERFFEVGDKVVVMPLYHCGDCEYCKRGLTQYCVDKQSRRFPGFAEYCVVHVRQVFKIPKDADLKAYALTEPMACGMTGIDKSNIRPGSNVAISGTGGVGQLILAMILLRGGANVTAIDPAENKRKTALEMGAQYTIDPVNEDVVARGMEITNGMGYDVIFEASGARAAAPPLLKMIAKGGEVVYFAVFPMDYELPVNLFDLYSTEGQIKTAYYNHTVVPRVIQLIPRMPMDKIIGTVVPLKDLGEAFEIYKTNKYGKILVEC